MERVRIGERVMRSDLRTDTVTHTCLSDTESDSATSDASFEKVTLGVPPRTQPPAPGSMRVAAAPARAPRAFVRAPRRGPPPARHSSLADLLSDSSVAVLSYALSDVVAQVGEVSRPMCAVEDEACLARFEAEREVQAEAGRPRDDSAGVLSALDVDRLKRFATFGAMDGAVSHWWYHYVEAESAKWPAVSFLPEGPGRVAQMVAADMLVFSPFWCAFFLAAMTVLAWNQNTPGPGPGPKPPRGSLPNAVLVRLSNSWSTLYLGDLLAWIPLNSVLYGLVPADNRVQAFGVINLAYTAVLSWWSEKTRNAEAEETKPPPGEETRETRRRVPR